MRSQQVLHLPLSWQEGMAFYPSINFSRLVPFYNETKSMNNYSSVRHICNTHRCLLPKPKEDWRLIGEPFCGEILGIPNFRGMAIATNGIMVAIEKENGLVFGHLDYFIADDREIDYSSLRSKAKGVQKKELSLIDFLA